jgi:hypothetical protein
MMDGLGHIDGSAAIKAFLDDEFKALVSARPQHQHVE